MDNLLELPVFIIDDVEDHSNSIKKGLSENGFKNIKTFFSEKTYQSAIEAAIGTKNGLLICDYKLDGFSPGKRGGNILKRVRIHNADIQLILHTAFKPDVSDDLLEWYDKNNIKVYEKTPDYKKTSIKIKRCVTDFYRNKMATQKPEINTEDKQEALQHLCELPNKELEMPLSNDAVFTVKDLIAEVEHETPSGLVFIKDWKDTTDYINILLKKSRSN